MAKTPIPTLVLLGKCLLAIPLQRPSMTPILLVDMYSHIEECIYHSCTRQNICHTCWNLYHFRTLEKNTEVSSTVANQSSPQTATYFLVFRFQLIVMDVWANKNQSVLMHNCYA